MKDSNQIGEAVDKNLREFIYLDRDSVVSLLASIEGAIKEEKVEQIASKSEKRKGGELNASISGVGARINGEKVDMDENSTEVVHNYAIQSLFDQLEQHRRKNDDIGIFDEKETSQKNLREIERSDVMKVEVELETHYLFRFHNVLTHLHENFPQASNSEQEELLNLIGSMFGSEVPVSGKLLDYHIIDGEIKRISSDCDERGEPLYIVGHLNIEKLWQDIPNALFNKEEYTVFCRVKRVYTKDNDQDDNNEKGEDEWHPIDIAQRIESVSKPLAQKITFFMERAARAAEKEAGEGNEDQINPEDWIEKLAKFDEFAAIDSITDSDHRSFVGEYLLEVNDLPPASAAGNMELYEFYGSYANYLRENKIPLSKSMEERIKNELICEDNFSEDTPQNMDYVDGPHIESKIIAVYW
ncbi:DUF6414 family protein [Natronococcus jeotgali]|uniref:DUF6414 family protein n=1 Tax=Natronococcus jeotgali TaxID=413812 RepID=UPI0012683C6A|nr:hypothetical protein [Natronococcus jeotgali]